MLIRPAQGAAALFGFAWAHFPPSKGIGRAACREAGMAIKADKLRLRAIYWAQISIGMIYLLTGILIPFLLTNEPMLDRLFWAAVMGVLPGLCLIAACIGKK